MVQKLSLQIELVKCHMLVLIIVHLKFYLSALQLNSNNSNSSNKSTTSRITTLQSNSLQHRRSLNSRVEIVWRAARANRNTKPYSMVSKLRFKRCLKIAVNSNKASPNLIQSTLWPMESLIATPTNKWCLWTCSRPKHSTHMVRVTSQWQLYQAPPLQTNKTSKCKKCYLVRRMKLSQDSS